MTVDPSLRSVKCVCGSPFPHRHRPPVIHTTIPGIRSKRNTPTCAILQEVAATFDERLSGRVKVFTDGSVLKNGSAAAACTIPELSSRKQCRLRGSCSSTLAELAAFDLAVDLVIDHLPPAVAILTDSRAALQTLWGKRGKRSAHCPTTFHEVRTRSTKWLRPSLSMGPITRRHSRK